VCTTSEAKAERVFSILRRILGRYRGKLTTAMLFFLLQSYLKTLEEEEKKIFFCLLIFFFSISPKSICVFNFVLICFIYFFLLSCLFSSLSSMRKKSSPSTTKARGK
jgi:hypothetical protein